MIKSLLVANRGEIACRVFRTAKRLGIQTIAVYSQADSSAPHVKMADKSYLLGPAPALESYLDISKVIDAAKQSGAQAIHPGYGFLSENAEFALACEEAGIIFVGPPVNAIRDMGSKMMSKRLMEQANVPVLPGYHDDNQDEEHLLTQAKRIGFPLLIKASAGGGGKGMRLVETEEDFIDQLQGARREAKAAFSDDKVLLEKYLTAPKHIEVQVMADQHGNVVHLFERDCSVQRRHQKVIEEAPGPTVSESLRQQLGRTAVAAAKQVDYVGAGTVEFIAEDNEFYFMEMNTRLQVEHPVTEMVTDLDLVELQLRVASGQELPLKQEDVKLNGHAVEVRLYAENPAKKFLPATGELACYEINGDVRVDTGVEQNSVISPHYDPMLAKIIAHGENRSAAISKLISAIQASFVAGVEHNLGYLANLLDSPEFRAGDYTTAVAETLHEQAVPKEVSQAAALAANFVLASSEENPWKQPNGFRLNLPAVQVVELKHGKQKMLVERVGVNSFKVDDNLVNINVLQTKVVQRQQILFVMMNGHAEKFTLLHDNIDQYQGTRVRQGDITSPMPGQVIAVKVAVGDKVKQGDELSVVEAMKMEHSVLAPKAGEVTKVNCVEGDRVEEGVVLAEVE